MLSQPSIISRLEISGAKYFFVYLEPCKLTWVASFSSPCASTHPYALSRFILSEPLFICPPDTLHPLHDGCMPLHTIHPGFSPLYASPFYLMLQTSPQLMKTPKAQSHLLGLSITWKLTLSCYKLSKCFGPRIHILAHVSGHLLVLSYLLFLQFSVQGWCLSLMFTCALPKSLYFWHFSQNFGLFVAELLMRSDGPIFWFCHLL